jgi:hypothetical protein
MLKTPSTTRGRRTDFGFRLKYIHDKSRKLELPVTASFDGDAFSARRTGVHSNRARFALAASFSGLQGRSAVAVPRRPLRMR